MDFSDRFKRDIKEKVIDKSHKYFKRYPLKKNYEDIKELC